MSRELKASEELENTYISERVAYLLPQFEALAPYKLNRRKKGVPNEDLLGWERLAAIEAKNLKLTYPDERPEDEREYGTALRQITALKKALKSAAKTDLKDNHTTFAPQESDAVKTQTQQAIQRATNDLNNLSKNKKSDLVLEQLINDLLKVRSDFQKATLR